MTPRSLLLAALPALLVGGCGGTANRGLESVHQPVVSRTDLAFDLDARSGPLSPGEAARLDGWFQTIRLGYGDRVAVDGSAGPSRAAAEIGGVLARYGLLLGDEAPVTGGAVTPGTVRVVVSRMRADVPGCPDWSRNVTTEFEGNSHSNFGCAANSNLAAMIANPADLVRGAQGSEVIDAAFSAKAIGSYRAAAPTGAGGALGGGGSAGGKK